MQLDPREEIYLELDETPADLWPGVGSPLTMHFFALLPVSGSKKHSRGGNGRGNRAEENCHHQNQRSEEYTTIQGRYLRTAQTG